jgi:putative tryptophan/tyrosine transport system substrate-binding protein
MNRRELVLLLGGAMTAARTVRAQQKPLPVIGWLNSNSPGPSAPFVDAFHRGLSEAGYVVGQNAAIEYGWAEGRHDRLPALAADLVGRRVDVIVAGGGVAALAAKNATSTIPIVFATGGDPVESGLVASLARPGGNLTGVGMMFTELMPKLLELLSELVPQARVIALLVNPKNSLAEGMIRDVQKAANAKGVQLPILKAPKTRSTPLSRPLSKCKPAGSSSAPMLSSASGANSSWPWYHAMASRRSFGGVSSPRKAG